MVLSLVYSQEIALKTEVKNVENLIVMKNIFLILLAALIFVNPHKIWANSCESFIKTRAAENTANQLNNSFGTRVKQVFNPEKTDWNRVNELLSQYPRTNPETKAWISGLVERSKTGQGTWEEYLAAMAAINPERGLNALKYAENNTLLRYRTKLFGSDRAIGQSRIDLVDLKNLVQRDVVRVPGTIQDFEKFMLSLYSSLGPKAPHMVMTGAAKEGVHLDKWGQAYRLTEKERDLYMIEARQFYDDLQKLMKELKSDKSSLSQKDLDKIIGKYLKKPLEEARKAGLNLHGDPEKILAELYSKYDLRETKHYYWKAVKGLAMLAIFGPGLNMLGEEVQKWRNEDYEAGKKQAEDLENGITNSPMAEEEISLSREQLAQINYPTEKLLQSLNEEKTVFNPYPLLNNKGVRDEIKYPCDSSGILYETFGNQKQTKDLSIKIQRRIKAQALGVDSTMGPCLEKIKKQLMDEDLKSGSKVKDQMKK